MTKEPTKEPESREKKNDREPLTEGIDYYVENGLYVFTAHFLKQRGYCCESGCRHCPYSFTKPS